MLIDRIPLRKPVCDECLTALWRNVMEPEEEPTPPSHTH